HEAGHLLEGSRRDYLDAVEGAGNTDEEEKKADRFARDTLIPPRDYATFLQSGDFSEDAIRSFAQTQALAPGIVVGRLHRDGHVDPPYLITLKKPIRWPKPMP